MLEKTTVKGVLVAMKGDGSHFLVDQLRTPIGVMESAVLRSVRQRISRLRISRAFSRITRAKGNVSLAHAKFRSSLILAVQYSSSS